MTDAKGKCHNKMSQKWLPFREDHLGGNFYLPVLLPWNVENMANDKRQKEKEGSGTENGIGSA